MYHMDTAEPIRKSAKTGKSTKLFIVVYGFQMYGEE